MDDRPSDGRNFRPRLCGLCKQDLPSSPLAPLSKLRTRPEKHFFSSPFQPSGKPHVKRRPPAPIFFRGRNGGLRLLYGVSFRKSRSAAHRPRQFGNHQLSDPLRQGAVEKNVERLYHRRNCLRRNLFRRMSPVFGAYSAAYLFPAILSQILYFVSGVLLVVLLRFRGEKKQFFLNLGYAIVFFALTLIATYLFGLNGFVWASLLANALRLAVVIPWGFLPPRRKAAPPPPEETEQS